MDYWIGPEGVFSSWFTAIVFVVVQVGFMLTESRRRKMAPADARRSDARFFPSVGLALMLGLVARFVFGFLKIGVVMGPARDGVYIAGLLLTVAGWLLRIWAQQHTGRFFTGEVAVQQDHQVVTSGPYRWVRHPSYTGGILSAIGFGLMLNTWLGALISGVLLIWAYAIRVPREEALLAQHLGDAYRAYMTRTKRFVPFIV